MKKYIILLIPFALMQCCKEEIPSTSNTCLQGLLSFTTPASEVVDSSILECDNCVIDCQELYSSAIPYDYTYPCFNPMNGEQLAYYRFDNTALNVVSELWVKDFCTGQKTKLVDNALYGLDWSVTDWLIYTAEDQNIWKIKSNGDSLTQLTFEGDFNRHPKWSPNGDRIAFNTQTGSMSYFIIADGGGISLDTLEELWTAGQWSWIDKNKICYMVSDTTISGVINMNYFDMVTDEIHFLHSLVIEDNNVLLVQNTVYSPSENSILWSAYGTLGKTNLFTGEFQIIRERLLEERFHFLTIRPGGDEIVVNKSSRHYVENCRYDSEVEFFLFDVSGENQRKIKIDD